MLLERQGTVQRVLPLVFGLELGRELGMLLACCKTLATTSRTKSSDDVYVLKWILHDWDDDDALRVLQAVRNSMTAEARLLVLERVGDARATDAHMWVCLGGRNEVPRPSRDSWRRRLRHTQYEAVRRRRASRDRGRNETVVKQGGGPTRDNP